MSKHKPAERLEPYHAKRSTQRTPEPFGAGAVARPRLFVVQKHAATRLHYDFRLEWGGTLRSWAVPKGPSADPSVKRFAVQVEDHPVDYADFEGVIPKGNYGAGAVIVWDKGLWVPLDDPDQLEETGKLHFELRGYKLRGIWLLIRMRGKEWLLRKKPDAWSRPGESSWSEASVHSGLTVEELGTGTQRARDTRERLDQLGARRRHLDPMTMSLMLASTAEAPFSSPDWIYEIKVDGYRTLAFRRDKEHIALRSRNGHDLAAVFPELVRALRALPYENLVLDGEIAVVGEDGRADFGQLQQRARLSRTQDIERAAIEKPATLFAFDLLGFEGYDVRPLPLHERKSLLRPLLPELGPVRYADHVVERGQEMFEQAVKLGLEGILAKRAEAPWVGRRSRHWLKIVVEHTEDFVVVGFTRPRGHRQGFGALLLGIHEDDRLVFAGRVGTGFDEPTLAALAAELGDAEIAAPPCEGAPEGRDLHWTSPRWVVEVRYKQVTRDGQLRAPVFVRLRDDKAPEDCRREPRRPALAAPVSAPVDAALPAAEEASRTTGEAGATPSPPRLAFTNLDKVYWPDDGITKGDLLAYYERVAAWMLPYLADRPLVLTRYPDGITGKSFYQKNAPDFVPRWIPRVRVWSESSQREIEYFVCDRVETLLYVANLGAIPLHVWLSRSGSIQHPDFCLIDLDPKEAPFRDVITLARAVHALCEEIELPSFVKTTGSTGLHVLIPLGGHCTFHQSQMLGQLIARIVQAQHPDIATLARAMTARKGRVYLDYLQNRHGQLMVAPYAVRPLPGAPVSAPLEWSEVNARLTPRKWTVRNLPRRLARKKSDPLRAVLETKPDLVAALARLAARLEKPRG